MAISRVAFGIMAVAALVFAFFFPAAQAGVEHAAPSNAGNTIDQAIACVLMLVALVLTYLIHAADISYGLQ